MGALDLLERVCWGGWRTRWGPSEELKRHYPPRHSDFRDNTPLQLEEVYELYQPMVQEGRWTQGLIEMWFFKHKPVKTAVHIPCWDSFKWNPLKWRGYCFGRTLDQCLWTGLRQTRWARAVYAANLGREYTMPFAHIGRHGYKSDIKALCWMYCLMGCIFGCGVGQLASFCGNFLCNFAAWYSCHARERLRRRYNLPPTFCLPPGIDDCLVHFWCFYCASHQELRELAVRGVDGPGMHILDVLPDAFPNAPGIEQAKAERRKVVERMLARPPKMFRARGHAQTVPHWQQRVAHTAETLARTTSMSGGEAEVDILGLQRPVSMDELSDSDTASASTLDADQLGRGWLQYAPPRQQEMRRVTVEAAAPAGAALEAAPAPLQIGPGFEAAAAAAAAAAGTPAAWHALEQYPEAGDGGRSVLQHSRAAGPMRRHSEQRMVRVIEEEAPEGEAGGRLLQRAWSVAY